MNAPVTWLLLRRFTLRHWRQAPRSSLVLVCILALGVAVFVSIRLANRAAVASFAHFTETLTGQSDYIISAPAGTLPESILPELRRALGARPVDIVPIVEATAALPAPPGDAHRFGRATYILLGADLPGLANLDAGASSGQGFFDQENAGDGDTGTADRGGDDAGRFWQVYENGPQVWVSSEFRPRVPRQLTLVVNDRVVTLPVAGVIPEEREGVKVPATLLVMDRGQLQRLVGKTGRIDRVEFIIEKGPDALMESRRAELRELLEYISHGRWRVTTPGARRETAETMTRAFRLNLTVLSLIALLVGLYLIFQSLDGAVVRRRAEIAVLRALGVEPGVIQRVWLAESAVLGIVGGAAGVLLGWAGAQLAVRAVGQTVNALYFSTTVRAASLAPSEIFLGMALGLAASMVAGWWPARLAARTPPAQILPRTAPAAPLAQWRRRVALGAGALFAGVCCAQLPPWRLAGAARFPLAGYAAALCWIVGGGLLCGWLLPVLARALRTLGGAGVPARLALSHLRAPSGRHLLAVAALHCAVGMAAGMAILVASFELTVREWVARALQADIYIASDGAQSASAESEISPAVADQLAGEPEVATAARLTAYPLELDNISTLLTGSDLAIVHARSDLPWVQPPRNDAVWDVTRNGSFALVSEAFAERFRRRRGDIVTLPTPTGPRRLEIAGVFADYGNERGSLLVDRAHLRDWFGEDRVSNVSLWLKPGADPEAFRAALAAKFPGLSIFTNIKLREEVLRIFRQTFAITYSLEIVAVLVAVAGLALTLMSILLDRRAELTTLRALGLSRRELAVAAALEGASVAAAAVTGGLVLSAALGWLLIYVINKQSFGWTLGFYVPAPQLAGLAIAVIATGAAVSFGVGWWGADLPADREE